MVYYPLQTLIESGIKDILIVSGGENISDFLRLLGSGKDFGINLTYKVQDGSGGIPIALALAKEFVGNEKFVVILGDNIIEKDIKNSVEEFSKGNKGCKIFIKEVSDSARFGIAEIKNDKITAILEKPANPKTNLAITRIYMFDKKAFDMVPALKPSARGELEITDVLRHYMNSDDITFEIIDCFWVDAGTFEGLYEATNFVVRNLK